MIRRALSFAFFLICANPAFAQTAVPVQTRSFSLAAIYPDHRAPASLQSRNHSRLSAEVGARIAALPVEVGQTVQAGAVLARLDDSDARLAVERAQAQLAAAEAAKSLAKSQLARSESLQLANFGSPQAVDQVRTELNVRSAEVQVARAALNTAKQQLNKHVIRAPFRGAVVARAQLGEWATPGAALVELVDLQHPEVSARVPVADVASLQAASKVDFLSQGKRYPLRLLRIAPVVNKASRDQEVRLIAVDQAPAVGAAGQIAWNDPRPHLPPQFTVKRGAGYGVFTVQQGRARWIPLSGVQEGRPALAALPASTPIVVDGQQALRAGDAVKIGASTSVGRP